MTNCFDISDDNLKGICGFYPFEMLSPNGKPMFGIALNYAPVFGVTEKTPMDTLYFLFLKRSWPFILGYNLFRYGIRNVIRSIFIRGEKNVKS